MGEIKNLTERASKYLKSASLLFEEKDFESCVSRIYYAMFYMIEALLLSKDMAFSSHRGVISAFGEYFIKTGIFPREMGRDLNLAFQKRQLSDYEYSFVIIEKEASQLLASGRSFVDIIKSFLKQYIEEIL